MNKTRILLTLTVGAMLLRALNGTLLHLWNWVPLTAVILCASTYVRGWRLWVIPCLGMVMTDVLLNRYNGFPAFHPSSLLSWGCYSLALLTGYCIREARSGKLLLGLTVFHSFLFYFVTNTLCWWTEPAYQPTFSGWIQCLTLGIPGFPPTYLFLFKSLAGDIGFTLLTLLLMNDFEVEKLQGVKSLSGSV